MPSPRTCVALRPHNRYAAGSWLHPRGAQKIIRTLRWTTAAPHIMYTHQRMCATVSKQSNEALDRSTTAWRGSRLVLQSCRVLSCGSPEEARPNAGMHKVYLKVSHSYLCLWAFGPVVVASGSACSSQGKELCTHRHLLTVSPWVWAHGARIGASVGHFEHVATPVCHDARVLLPVRAPLMSTTTTGSAFSRQRQKRGHKWKHHHSASDICDCAKIAQELSSLLRRL